MDISTLTTLKLSKMFYCFFLIGVDRPLTGMDVVTSLHTEGLGLSVYLLLIPICLAGARNHGYHQERLF